MKSNYVKILLMAILVVSFGCNSSKENNDTTSTATIDKSVEESPATTNDNIVTQEESKSADTTSTKVEKNNGFKATKATEESGVDMTHGEKLKFLDALLAVQKAQDISQKELIDLIESSGLKLERYATITQQKGDAVVTPDEKEQMLKIQPKIRKMQAEQQAKMMIAVKSADFDITRYQDIVKMIQMNPEFSKEMLVLRDSLQLAQKQ